MPNFTITEVVSQKPWDSKYGPMIAYKVRFEGEQGTGEAQLNQKAGSPAPKIGETVDGLLEPTDFGYKLKRVHQQKAISGKSAQERAEIRRLAAQKAAIELLRLEIETGRVPKDAKASALLTPRIDFFDDDCKLAGEKA